MKNIFIYGMSGSGKDTISNFLRDNCRYLKMRIAGTIKQIITEENCISMDELDVLKRDNPDIRKRHNEVGVELDKTNSSIKRLGMIINHTARDYEITSQKTNIVICDVRGKEELDLLIKAGWYGIYLTRRNNEYTPKHWTEESIFENNEFYQMFLEYQKTETPMAGLVICNNEDSNKNDEVVDKIIQCCLESQINDIERGITPLCVDPKQFNNVLSYIVDKISNDSLKFRKDDL